ncbi:hypothetical protein E2562_007002 [Oryza meyeriana var. granulata]|uniref:DUF834 domain-containing protein n=1 Tax=Oryza meyeriana var. granulata TaxID=110450 RepID=A0A6G1E9K5_9ORYZ|nr:hypothetical protein E2562_007002 [Oryza meyeriana var. granulata]
MKSTGTAGVEDSPSMRGSGWRLPVVEGIRMEVVQTGGDDGHGWRTRAGGAAAGCGYGLGRTVAAKDLATAWGRSGRRPVGGEAG